MSTVIDNVSKTNKTNADIGPSSGFQTSETSAAAQLQPADQQINLGNLQQNSETRETDVSSVNVESKPNSDSLTNFETSGITEPIQNTNSQVTDSDKQRSEQPVTSDSGFQTSENDGKASQETDRQSDGQPTEFPSTDFTTDRLLVEQQSEAPPGFGSISGDNSNSRLLVDYRLFQLNEDSNNGLENQQQLADGLSRDLVICKEFYDLITITTISFRYCNQARSKFQFKNLIIMENVKYFSLNLFKIVFICERT